MRSGWAWVVASALVLAPGAVMAAEAPATPPPAAVAVVFDKSGGAEARVVRGLDRLPDGKPVTADHLVRIASISKLVVGLGVMRLAEAGKLDLDADVSRYLGWQLRHPAHPGRKITLAHLLSHRSGITDAAGYALALDADLPTHLTDAKAWDRARRPGGAFEYANLNSAVIAAAIEGVTGERFDLAMQRLVLKPLGVEACYNWASCDDAALGRVVTLYRTNGDVATDDLRGQRPACPVNRASDGSCDLTTYRLTRHGAAFSPQGGLRISMNGLARIGTMVLRGGDGFVSRASLARMARMRDAKPGGGEGSDGLFCAFGMAMHVTGGPDLPRKNWCRSDLFGDGRRRVGHAGDAFGLRSGLFMDLSAGTGIAFFVTQVDPDAKGLRSAYGPDEEAIVDAAEVARPLASRASAD